LALLRAISVDEKSQGNNEDTKMWCESGNAGLEAFAGGVECDRLSDLPWKSFFILNEVRDSLSIFRFLKRRQKSKGDRLKPILLT
jgi:hypothetical protein